MAIAATVSILGLCASLRIASVNSTLLRATARLAPRGYNVSISNGLGALPLLVTRHDDRPSRAGHVGRHVGRTKLRVNGCTSPHAHCLVLLLYRPSSDPALVSRAPLCDASITAGHRVDYHEKDYAMLRVCLNPSSGEHRVR
jgi:hypothetical protein